MFIAILSASAMRLAHAENKTELNLNYFIEPSKSQRLNIVIPQFSVSADVHPNVSLNLGYDADIVSGATPRIYGAQMDAITSATHFSDVRHAPHAGIQLRPGPVTLDAGYTFSTENDYRSHQLNVGAKVDLWGKNTTVAMNYSHNWDEVCNVDNTGATPLERRALTTSEGCFSHGKGLVLDSVTVDSYALSLSQVLHPRVAADLTASFEVIQGFQSNPYRLVSLFNGSVEAQEASPNLRQRVALQARLHVAVPNVKGAVMALGRFYTDTWGVRSFTAELDWQQYLLPQLLLRLRGRFYEQGRAVFYRDAGESLSYDSVGPVGQYFTGDRELSPFRDYLLGVKLSYLKFANEKGKIARVFQSLDLHLKAEGMKYETLTPLPPNAARANGPINAIITQIGIALLW